MPHLFAVGDVTDRINLTPVAIREGQAFAQTETVAILATLVRGAVLEPDPGHMADVADWMHDRVGELFISGLPWCAGARELHDALHAADVPMALVTNTRRALTEKALNSIGRQYFSVTVCGDEVPHGKPAPDVYLRAAELLGFAAADCLAIEDSVTGTAAAEAAGCPVLVVPNEVEVPVGARRVFVESLSGLSLARLRSAHGDLTDRIGEPAT